MPPTNTAAPPIVDPKVVATEYLKKNRILQLFEELGAYIVLEQPADPEEFLITKLKEIKEAKKQKNALTFFTEEDISAMFSMFDPTGKGYINAAQYQQALKNFGVDQPKHNIPTEERIGRKLFETNMLAELIERSITKS